jgi:hypothetical protein
MLDHHPSLAVANDTHFIPKALDNDRAGGDPPLSAELVEEVASYRRFYRLGIGADAVETAAAGATTYSGFVARLYDELAALRGKPLAGEKTPDYVRHLPLLHLLFPWARMVHIVRDGRDVALSTLEWARPDKGPGRFELWSSEPVAVCALWWEWLVRTGRRDGASLGSGRYLEVGYERLVADPEPEIRRIASFLELEFAPEMLTSFERKTRVEPGLSAKSAWLPPTPGLRDWRAHMAARDVELFEALAGTTLRELGYPTTYDTISRDTAELAEHCRAWWRAEMVRRDHRNASDATQAESAR